MNTVTTTFSRDQKRKGLAVCIAFLILRVIVMQVWYSRFGSAGAPNLVYLFFLIGLFLVFSVGIVALGLGLWARIDLRRLWLGVGVKAKDILIGVLTGVGLTVLLLAGAFVIKASGAAPAQPASPDTSHLLTNMIFTIGSGLFFAAFIASFCEETLFRGFLQSVLRERLRPLSAVVIQASVFSLAHLGIEPFSSLPQFLAMALLRFLAGTAFGWIVWKRGSLLAAGIAHAITG